MLKITNLSASYNKGPLIIKKINLQVKEGEIVTIIGPNGAGKSTILRSIFGLTNIQEGEVNFYGDILNKDKTEDIIKKGIAYVPQGKSLFTSMTVEENLLMGAFTITNKSEVSRSLAKVYGQFPDLYERRHQVARGLSGGQQQMVAIGRALMSEPKLLLLDEPSIGLAPLIVEEVFQNCQKIKKDGVSVLMVEQNAKIALEYSDFGYALELGENKFSAAAKEVLKNPKIGELYLGK
jgi:branched-chain amino acid transport system ATP-binding protein